MSSALAFGVIAKYRDRLSQIGAGLRQLDSLDPFSPEFSSADTRTHDLILTLPSAIMEACQRVYENIMERFHPGYSITQLKLRGEKIHCKYVGKGKKRSGLRFLVSKGGSQSSGNRVIARIYDERGWA